MTLGRFDRELNLGSPTPDGPLSRALVLRQPAATRAQVAALAAEGTPQARDALLELVAAGEPARLAAEAAQSLASAPPDAAVDEALSVALGAVHGLVRIAATRALAVRRSPASAARLLERLAGDPAWICRQSALHGLAEPAGPPNWSVMIAATDPHWRVRHALVDALMAWEEAGAATAAEIDARLLDAPGPAAEGVRLYLAWRRSDRLAPLGAVPAPADPLAGFVLSDPDPMVMARDLRALSRTELRALLPWMPRLVEVDHDGVRRVALDTLRRYADTVTLAEALRWLDDPRVGAAHEAAARLLESLDLDRREELSLHLLAAPLSPARLAWALGEVGDHYPAEAAEGVLGEVVEAASSQAAVVRAALAGLWRRSPSAIARATVETFLDDPEPSVVAAALRSLDGTAPALDAARLEVLSLAPHAAVREAVLPHLATVLPARLKALARDPAMEVRLALARLLSEVAEPVSAELRALFATDRQPMIRAAALDIERAHALLRDPEQETSWLVLEAACHLAKSPIWSLQGEPGSVAEPLSSAPVLPPAEPSPPSPPRHARPLGPDGLLVSPLSISGHYGLPAEGFGRAAEAGVNLFFWEPNYQSLSAFMQSLTPRRRQELHLLAGTFEADAKGVRRDVERALRTLGIPRLTFFLVYWVRSSGRMNDEVRAELDQLVAEGLVGTWGLSSHDRGLLCDALNAGVNPLMARHSMAHRGAETAIFPAARARGVGLITFNNTCYGRLLRPHGPHPPATAADCYRYTLSFPEVATCFSAPATLAQLDENLALLDDITLTSDRIAQLRAHGDAVHAENTTFARCVRWL